MELGVIVDVETTGTDPASDQIIEIGILLFGVLGVNKAAVLNCYSGLEDPGKPLKSEISALTGLTDDLLKDQRIDWNFVRQILEKSDLVIAHNAEFDASFLRKRPELKDLDLHWACSVRHIDWAKRGFKSRALNYLAADHGFLNPFAHRALFDCATTLRLVEPYLAELSERSYEREYLLCAVGAAYDKKEALKNHGYRWDSEKRFWAKRVLACDLEEERHFLSESVYGGVPRHEEIDIPPL